MKTNWLDRRIAKPGPYLCLCLSEKEYQQAIKEIGTVTGAADSWIPTDSADAVTHVMENAHGDIVCVVCLRPRPPRNGAYAGVEIAGLLVHEAVHVKQKYFEAIGERHPGDEQEAYAVQGIAQELMAEYARRMK